MQFLPHGFEVASAVPLRNERLQRVLSLLSPCRCDTVYNSSRVRVSDICVDEVPFDIQPGSSTCDALLDEFIPSIRRDATPDDKRLLDLVYHHAVSRCANFTGSNHDSLCRHTPRPGSAASPVGQSAFARSAYIRPADLSAALRVAPPRAQSSFSADDTTMTDLLIHQLALGEQIGVLQKQMTLISSKLDDVMANQNTVYQATLRTDDKIFISHAGADKTIAVYIALVLEHFQLPTFLDLKDIDDNNQTAIFVALRKCSTVVLVATEKFDDSKWCLMELGSAQALQARIVCFRDRDLLYDEFPGNSDRGDLYSRLVVFFNILHSGVRILENNCKQFFDTHADTVWTRKLYFEAMEVFTP